jgi:hypothetical protein
MADSDGEDRKRTLETLISLAEGNHPTGCWDDGRAEELLRSQSSAEELRALGASETIILHIFTESHE